MYTECVSHNWLFTVHLGHDKMILCLAGAYASIFNTSRQAFSIKSACEFFLFHLLKIHSFKPLRYVCKCNN